MGFLSGVFGTNSEWDGYKYVEQVVGRKFWHKNFIDKDAMRANGQFISLQDYPLSTSRDQKQSPFTLVGELVYLMDSCEEVDDFIGQKAVARAMDRLLKSHGHQISPSADARFMMTAYSATHSIAESVDSTSKNLTFIPTSDGGGHDLMEEAHLYGITYDGQMFSFQGYRYAKLEDAINYAMMAERKR